jgi:transcriptional regulator with XRE-family HTH domain
MATTELVTTRRPASFNGNGSSETRRRELAAFLRSRRERVRPEHVGLPPSRRRRTPGLRREEVAQLAGVGVTWYTWLEQGRNINASPQVLDAIARTLQFDAHEHAHLFTLAGLPSTAMVEEPEALAPTVRPLLDRLEPYPAALLNTRWDILAMNRVQASFFDDVQAVRSEDRNCIWLAFMDPSWRRVIVDWDDSVSRMVAEYRAAMADHIDDPAWQAFIDRLHRASPEFTAFWERHDVLGVYGRTKRLIHPQAGLLELEYTNLWLDQRLGQRIVVLTPLNELSRQRLDAVHRSLA